MKYGRHTLELKKEIFPVQCQNLDDVEHVLCTFRGMVLNGKELTTWSKFRGKFGRDSRVKSQVYFSGVVGMSYFNDELRDVIGCIKNEDSASVLEFFTELKRKIDSEFEIYSEFDLQLIFSDISIQDNFSECLSSIELKRIILWSILKNKDKKISIDDFIRSIFESHNQLNINQYTHDEGRKIMDIVRLNDNEIISKFSYFSIGSVVGLLSYLASNYFRYDNIDIFDNFNLSVIIIVILYNILNIGLCFGKTGSLNFVKFEKENLVTSLIARWSISVPLITLVLSVSYFVFI
jgi:hypothetical protein